MIKADIVGIEIGTAKSLEIIDWMVEQYYDFIPKIPGTIPSCSCLTIDYDSNTFAVYNEAGIKEWFSPILPIISELIQSEKEAETKFVVTTDDWMKRSYLITDNLITLNQTDSVSTDRNKAKIFNDFDDAKFMAEHMKDIYGGHYDVRPRIAAGSQKI